MTFEQGTNPDTAQVQVQNKVQQALPRLPSAVQQQGVNVTKSQNDFLMIVALSTTLTDHLCQRPLPTTWSATCRTRSLRVHGVGGVQVFGSQYAMRIWLDPAKLLSLQPHAQRCTRGDRVAEHSGIGRARSAACRRRAEQQLNATVTAQSKLQTPDQFRAIIVKHDTSGATVRLGDVARVELGSESYDAVPRAQRPPGVWSSR